MVGVTLTPEETADEGVAFVVDLIDDAGVDKEAELGFEAETTDGREITFD